MVLCAFSGRFVVFSLEIVGCAKTKQLLLCPLLVNSIDENRSCFLQPHKSNVASLLLCSLLRALFLPRFPPRTTSRRLQISASLQRSVVGAKNPATQLGG
jgi:hypothetical protein